MNASDVPANSLTAEAVSCGVPFLIAPLASRDAVSRARLDRATWERVLANGWTKEVYLFDASAVPTGNAIRARMFAPDLGIGEDPATGSAAACLAAYLAKHAAGNAKLSWTVEQGFEMGRPSILSLSAEKKDGRIGAVRVGGKSVLVSEGTIRVG